MGVSSREIQQQCRNYYLIEKALYYLEANYQRQPSLEEMAASAGLSPSHFHRLFSRWAGITPKRFLQFLKVQHARNVLEQSQSLLEASYEAGLSSPGRMHDLFVVLEALTPGEYRKKGAGVLVEYGFHETPLGVCLLAVTSRGICGLSFHREKGEKAALQDLQGRWPGAELRESPETTRAVVEDVSSFLQGKREKGEPFALHVKGTNFQVKVWEALLRIPSGYLLSYEGLAGFLGNRRATRAVAAAVAQNPVSYLIPCHRVIRKTGLVGGYRWGTARKVALLGREAAGTLQAKPDEPGESWR